MCVLQSYNIDLDTNWNYVQLGYFHIEAKSLPPYWNIVIFYKYKSKFRKKSLAASNLLLDACGRGQMVFKYNYKYKHILANANPKLQKYKYKHIKHPTCCLMLGWSVLGD